MSDLFVVAAALLAVGMGLWALGHWLTRGQGASAADRRAGVRLVPVPEDTRRLVMKLNADGEHVRAMSRLRRDVPVLSLLQARELVQRLDDRQPSTHHEALETLTEQFPQLAEQLRQLLRQDAVREATRLLRSRLGLDLATAHHLVTAYRGTD